MIFVVAFLVESLSTNIADERLVTGVNSDVSVQGGRPVERFSTNVAFVQLFFGVDDFVPTQRAGLSEALATDLTLEGTRSGMHRHVPGQIIMRIEHFTADFTGKCFGRSVASLSANRTGISAHHGQ